MTLSAQQFPEFFRAVNGDHDPFGWQIRLVESILDRGKWPDQITAPTGSGKSSVIEVHVFVNAVAAKDPMIRLPRRLIATVDRRALVDNQLDRAAAIADALSGSDAESLLGAIRTALRSLRTWRDPVRASNQGRSIDPGFDVAALRGGLPTDAPWRDDPAACAVICATPDMWGSRALFRGYGSSRAARPRDAGILTVDSVLVLDEAHLNQQLLQTGRRIGQLQGFAPGSLGVPGLQIVETTATPGRNCRGNFVSVGVTDADMQIGGSDTALIRRLTTPKPVRLVESPDWPAATAVAKSAIATQLAERALALRVSRARTVGVMVNTVDTAVRVAETLRKSQTEVRLIAGRMRPHDLAQMRTANPGLFTVAGDDKVDVLVATQTLEVGVDLNLSALVTELAPGSAIAQRAGRVNRLGELDDAVVEVIVPPPGSTVDRDAPPYGARDLASALHWLRRREVDPAGLAPWAVATDSGPAPAPARTLFQRLELADTWVLTDTSREPFADPDLDLWLSDQLDDSNDLVSIAVRRDLPIDSSVAMDLLRATPPLDDECFPVRIRDVKEIANRILTVAGTDLAKAKSISARAFRWRAGVLDVIASDRDIRPGDVVIIDDVHPILTENVVVVDGAESAIDVYDDVAVGVTRIVARSEDSPDRRVLGAVRAVLESAPKDTRDRRRGIAEAIAEAMDDVADAVELIEGDGVSRQQRPRLDRAVGLLRKQKRRAEIITGAADENGSIPWMVVRDLEGGMDDDLRQVRMGHGEEVTLDLHAADVERRAGVIAAAVGLGADLQHSLAEAGLHHDDGKADPRFQRMLQGTDPPDLMPERLLAKSGARTAAVARAATARINPTGWRHEQLSVVIASQALSQETDCDLMVLRLVGTSHGYGRGGFRHASEELLPADADAEVRTVAERLYDAGEWDQLLESTQERWGAWGCAYLESILRAADCQMSEEVTR